MEMKFGKAGFARRLLERNTGLIFGGEQLTSATEPTERVVMDKMRHEGMILAFDQCCRRPARRS